MHSKQKQRAISEFLMKQAVVYTEGYRMFTETTLTKVSNEETLLPMVSYP